MTLPILHDSRPMVCLATNRTSITSYVQALASAFHEALVASVEGVPGGRLRCARRSLGLGDWLSVVVGAAGGCQVAGTGAAGHVG